MSVIFISYRRSDSQDVTGRIYDRLVARYSSPRIFKDVNSIPLGVSFPMHLQQVLTKANVVLVIIGPNWVNARDAQGRRRLDDPSDFVRVEVECALRGRLPVIPILVSNAEMPHVTELPVSMRGLLARNGMSVRPDPDFNNDMHRLVSGISKLEKLLRTQPGKAKPVRSPEPITATLVAPPPKKRLRAKPVLGMSPDDRYDDDDEDEEEDELPRGRAKAPKAARRASALMMITGFLFLAYIGVWIVEYFYSPAREEWAGALCAGIQLACYIPTLLAGVQLRRLSTYWLVILGVISTLLISAFLGVVAMCLAIVVLSDYQQTSKLAVLHFACTTTLALVGGVGSVYALIVASRADTHAAFNRRAQASVDA